MKCAIYVFRTESIHEIKQLTLAYGAKLHVEESAKLPVFKELVRQLKKNSLDKIYILQAEQEHIKLNLLKTQCFSGDQQLSFAVIGEEDSKNNDLAKLVTDQVSLLFSKSDYLNIEQRRSRGAPKNNQNRKHKYKIFPSEFITSYFHLRSKNLSYREISKQLGVSVGTLTNIKNKIDAGIIQVPA